MYASPVEGLGERVYTGICAKKAWEQGSIPIIGRGVLLTVRNHNLGGLRIAKPGRPIPISPYQATHFQPVRALLKRLSRR
jgi:hypothetical protein